MLYLFNGWREQRGRHRTRIGDAPSKSRPPISRASRASEAKRAPAAGSRLTHGTLTTLTTLPSRPHTTPHVTGGVNTEWRTGSAASFIRRHGWSASQVSLSLSLCLSLSLSSCPKAYVPYPIAHHHSLLFPLLFPLLFASSPSAIRTSACATLLDNALSSTSGLAAKVLTCSHACWCVIGVHLVTSMATYRRSAPDIISV